MGLIVSAQVSILQPAASVLINYHRKYDFPPPRCADKWSPALQIRTVLLSIQALLSAPNPDDPLANDVAEQWKKEESKAIETGINKQ